MLVTRYLCAVVWNLHSSLVIFNNSLRPLAVWSAGTNAVSDSDSHVYCTGISVPLITGLAVCIGECVHMLTRPAAVWSVAPKWLIIYAHGATKVWIPHGSRPCVNHHYKRVAAIFNPTKCKVMHIGQPVQRGIVTKYFLSSGSTKVAVQSVNKDKDLGVYLARAFKSSKQCIKSAARARSVLGLVRRHYRRLDIDNFLVIYKT